MPRKSSRRSPGRFVGIPYPVASSHIFASLSGKEVKLLVDLLLQFNGRNNGMLSPCHSLMSKRGWPKSSLHRAFSSLQHRGFLVVTRQGWKQRGKPTLVAITWLSIDEPKPGTEYDDGIVSSNIPLGYWCKASEAWSKAPGVKRK